MSENAIRLQNEKGRKLPHQHSLYLQSIVAAYGTQRCWKDLNAFHYLRKLCRCIFFCCPSPHISSPAKETMNIGFTVGVSESKFRFMGSLTLNLWDCPG